MFTKLLRLSAGLIFGLAGIASDNGSQPTKFAVPIENITQPDAFTASTGAKWSLAFSPGLTVVHTEKAPTFNSGKQDRGQDLEAQSEDEISNARLGICQGLTHYLSRFTPSNAKGLNGNQEAHWTHNTTI